ncbi:undecaprenyldiphospho-muramoylpentapeptide beta-N-acetylglucosaminyltransferase [Sulfurimonas sp. NW15]|uniref:undecaprenyldiphospho-muramoylpentapeptide beta-N-acetylglucosaminyltransferase n=1 Tax=Sulfurimonas sp. NW15 TaxID=2922729 RepID=UPI003DA843D6
MKLCITGGGTGGHLMIAEALSEAAVADGYEVIFVGSTSGQDRKYFQKYSNFSNVYFLETTGVVNKKGIAKINALYKVFQAFLEARKILKKHKIQAVYSVGGFSAAPASFASLSLFIPLFIHEQNSVEGRLNRLLKKYAKSFISAYDKNSPVKGYPVKEFFYKNARCRDKLKTIIFLGGSHGAKAINDLALHVAYKLQKMDIAIIHQAGETDYERVRQEYDRLGVSVELYGFTKKLPELITRADLAVSRAGASTLWELTANGCPAFFVPYPHAAGDHQYYNAQFLVKDNVAWCEREGKNLKPKLIKVLKNPQLKEKSEKLLHYTNGNVAQQMIQDVQKKMK